MLLVEDKTSLCQRKEDVFAMSLPDPLISSMHTVTNA